MIVPAGKTNASTYIKAVENAGGGTPGAPKTGMNNTNVSSASYVRSGGLRVAISVSALGAVDAAHSDGGFIEVDATNLPGVYRFDIPDLAVATGVLEATIQLVFTGGSNAEAAPLAIELDVAGAVWDALGSSHLVAGSMGEKMKALAPIQTFVEASPAPTATKFEVDDITMTDGTMTDAILVFIDGDLIGQARRIKTSTVNGQNELTFDIPWEFEGSETAPSSGDRCVVIQGSVARGIADVVWEESYTDHVIGTGLGPINTMAQAIGGVSKTSSLHQNLSSGGTFSTTTFSTGLAEANDFWNGQVVAFTTGPNAGLSRRITDFVNTNGQVTVAPAFPLAPTASNRFVILPSQTGEGIADAIFDEILSEISAIPAAAPNFKSAVMLIFQSLRNKIVTDSGAGDTKIHNDAGTAIGTAAVSDAAGVFTRAKYT